MDGIDCRRFSLLEASIPWEGRIGSWRFVNGHQRGTALIAGLLSPSFGTVEKKEEKAERQEWIFRPPFESRIDSDQLLLI